MRLEKMINSIVLDDVVAFVKSKVVVEVGEMCARWTFNNEK